jgi:hypothetical protein
MYHNKNVLFGVLFNIIIITGICSLIVIAGWMILTFVSTFTGWDIVTRLWALVGVLLVVVVVAASLYGLFKE